MGGVKKSVYVFLCSLLGVLLFLVLHRLLVLWYLILVNSGVFVWSEADSYLKFLAVDYITLTLAMLAGSWYGIWLGSYWYEQVYELGAWKGSWLHITHKLLPNRGVDKKLKARVEKVREKLEHDFSMAEELIEEFPRPIILAKPKKRVAAKKPVAKKTPVRRKKL